MTKKRKKLNRYDIGGGLNIPGGLMEGIGISKQNIDLSSIKPEQLKIEGLQIPTSSNFNLGNTLGLASTALNAVTTGLNNSNIADTSSLENNIGKVGASAPTVSSTDDVLNAWSNLQHLDHVSWKDIRGGNAGSAATSALGAAASGASAGMAFGPVGSIIGGAIGGIASGIGSLFGRRKAKKKAKELNDKIDIANLTAEANLINASDNVNTQNALTLLANYSAYGGPINMEYTGVMSPFGNRFSEGGGIHIKPSKRGTFTSAAKKHGKSVQEFASQVLSNKDNYSSAMVKKANFARNASKWHSYGGELTHGGIFNNGVTTIDNGGTHEENPYEGVQMGVDNQGIPNLVEEGEVIWNDYVFSNRLAPTKEMKKQNRYKGKTFAEVAKNLQKESEERPNDPISKRGLEDSMSRLALLQEGIKGEKSNGNKFKDGGEKNSFKSPGIFDWNSTDLSGTIWDENLTKDVSNIMVPDTYNYVLENNNNNKLNNNSQSGKRLNSYLRYAPVLGSAIGLGQSLLSKPDYSSVEKIEDAANKLGRYESIGYTPIGNYMSYTPFDRNYYINKLNSQASATRRALINQSNGNRTTAMAGILAADYNAQEQLGNLARQAEEYNLAQRQRVEDFNRGTNMTNAEMKLKADMANQELRSRINFIRLNGILQAMNMKEAIDANRGASINANYKDMLESLGNIGKEEFTKDMILNNPSLLYDWMGNYKKTKESKKAKGGYLTIKKRRK